MTINFFQYESALDRQIIFEEQLEELRREYNLTSQKIVVKAQAQALIGAYFCDKTTQDRVLARWLN